MRKISSGTRRLVIRRTSGDKVESIEDTVVMERTATVFINDVELATLMCTPKDLDYLAVGFLFSEGLLTGKKDIKKVVVDDKSGVVWVDTKNAEKLPADIVARRFITTGCGKALTFVDASKSGRDLRVRSNASIPASAIPLLMKEFLGRSRLFKVTGGAHGAALCNSREILVFNEDIGRHNAIDKVVGECIMKGINMKDMTLATSGRVSSEILIKAARCRIPIIVSKSAPTDLAVKLADDFGITLVGFARGSRMNVYSNGRRIRAKAKTARRTPR